MGSELPKVPAGNGEHPVSMIVLTANNLAASTAFYAKVFGWRTQAISAELAAVSMPAGPAGALRSNMPAGFPGVIPYIAVSDVDAMLTRAVAAGATIERTAWRLPAVGTLARFKDPSGTIYGLTDARTPGEIPPIPTPFGSNPKPPAGAICSLEMYAADGSAAAGFFGELFGWGTLATMPSYMAFDPGTGVGGVFQSHTPDLPALAYVYATDVEAKIAEIEAAGGKRMCDPMRMPGMACFGYFKDPSGTAMGLIGP